MPFVCATVKTIRVVVVAATLVAFSSLGLQGSNGGPQGSNRVRRAHLSADLTRHQARRTTARERVIVHGTDRELDRLASRHRLKVIKRMRGAAVVLANSAELNDLSGDAAVDHLSGDLPVRGSTAIWDASTAADQTRAGKHAAGRVARHPGSERAGHRHRGHRFRHRAALGARAARRRERELHQRRFASHRRVWPRHARRRDHRRQPSASQWRHG